ncbi:MAG: phosphopantothenoylcysteine decarboxylase [Candidatus Omnitrophica bacterium]|nr:phosphopantothenoylcysteine decarboxylase [Candidatus Omnitrophota bacterium]MBU4589535.1 phosphopantothenoylcysteine decarboxylase [Candidatus Omnitrophota bacterium]
MKGRCAIKIIVTAGPTIERIDPVRFISNRSTGVMGYKVAEVASRKRHAVTLVSGPTKLKPPRVKKFISIETADDLLRVLKKEIKKADCLVMCAAVGDFRVASAARRKIKRKESLLLKLVPTKDILKELAKHKRDKLFVGFSLETEDLVKNSRKKLRPKKLDLIVANRLTNRHNPFGNNRLGVSIIDARGNSIYISNESKSYIAQVLLDKIQELWYLRKEG